jgi:uncharacterized protein GlcG (DUF336 family)
MLKTFETLSLQLQDAKRMLAAGEAKADQIGIPYNIAVVMRETTCWLSRVGTAP